MTGCAPASVQFFNQSSQNAQSYSWLFPGGTPETSGEKNPTVTYSQPGTYAATLIVSNAIGSDTFAVNAAVVVSAPPTVNFTTDVTDLTVQFVNTSMGATGGFLWNFGDGNTSTELSPKHTYAHEGIFTVTLIASNDCGETTVTQTVSTGAFPTAAFKATFSGGCAPITVQFINQSTGTDLDEFEWHFEGGTPSVSYEQNPVITFHSAGTFDVTLTVGNALGIHTTTMEDFVAVQAQPEAQFSFDAAELTVKFTNNSTGGDYTYWNFGDGTVSTEKSPTHTYVTPGVYSVMLTVANGACGSALAKEVHAFLTTGSSETVELQGVNVYPNPVVSELFISLEYLPGKNAVARLWSPDGRLLQSIPVTAKLTQLPVEALSSGMYWLEIREEQQHAWRKVVKM
jgi:PKD repeat protein